MASLLARANKLVRQRTLVTGVVAAGAKGILADAFSQNAFQHGEYNAARSAAFGVWNATYCGLACHLLYVRLFPRYLPLVLPSGARHPAARMRTMLMVGFDNFIATPLVCLPTLYLATAALEARAAGASITRRAAELYRSEWRETLKLSCALWVPIHTLTFSIVPVHWRVHFTAAASFVTLTAMSVLQGSLEKGRAPARRLSAKAGPG